MHWGKFDAAQRDLRLRPYTGHEATRDAALRALAAAQRFYLPDGSNVIEGKLIDDDLQKIMRLPFDVTAVLHESFVVETSEPVWVISVGVDASSDFCIEQKLAPPEIGIVVFSISFHREERLWVLDPLVGSLTFNGAAGYAINICDTGEALLKEAGRLGIVPANEYRADVTALMNLCVLLNTVAHSTRVPPPEKLNRARAKADRSLLPDYHVLTVGGQIWDDAHESGDGGNGLRSHLRRGHIRRLDADRFTWVKNTIVQGRREGFVKKDYIVKVPQ